MNEVIFQLHDDRGRIGELSLPQQDAESAREVFSKEMESGLLKLKVGDTMFRLTGFDPLENIIYLRPANDN